MMSKRWYGQSSAENSNKKPAKYSSVLIFFIRVLSASIIMSSLAIQEAQLTEPSLRMIEGSFTKNCCVNVTAAYNPCSLGQP